MILYFKLQAVGNLMLVIKMVNRSRLDWPFMPPGKQGMLTWTCKEKVYKKLSVNCLSVFEPVVPNIFSY